MTIEQRFGSEVLKNPEVRKKIKETMKSKYGTESYFSAKGFRKKAELSFFKKRGQELKDYLAQNHRSRFEFGSNRFDSSWELAVWIWSKDHNKEIIRQPVTLNYEYNGQSFTYYPDFSIDGQLVELKGPQFFDGSKMVNPYGRTQDDKYEAKHQCALDNNVQIWSSQEIQPILDYVSQTYSEDFLELFKTKFPYPKKCSTDNQVIKYFHKSLYHASKKKGNCHLLKHGMTNL